jgi:hypothetical protein
MEFHSESNELGRASIDIPLFAVATAANAALRPMAPSKPANVLNAAFERTRQPDWLPAAVVIFDIKD